MAPIPATLNISFNSNYSGTHRVCWRTGGSGPYNCTTVVSCSGGGNPCSASITVTVDQETCDDVIFDGYVQATCEDSSSLSGRVPFTVTFTPTPTCISYNIECSNVAVESITITNPGSAYNPVSPPSVSISGGGGTGATATAVVGDGGVDTWTVTNGGSGYDGGGSNTFLNVPANTLTGTGSGAVFDVVVTAGVVTSITLSSGPTSPGSGYAINDTFNFSPTDLGGTGTGVIITINSLNTGEVQYITVTAGGSGYTSVPTVTIDPSSGGGTDATATAVLAPCPPLDYGNNCDGDPYPTITEMELGQNFDVCYNTTPPVLPSEYTITPEGCCYDCVEVTISKPGSPDSSAVLTYTTCDGTTVSQGITQGFSVIECMKNNSWIVTQDDGTTNISVGSACP